MIYPTSRLSLAATEHGRVLLSMWVCDH